MAYQFLRGVVGTFVHVFFRYVFLSVAPPPLQNLLPPSLQSLHKTLPHPPSLPFKHSPRTHTHTPTLSLSLSLFSIVSVAIVIGFT